MRKSIFVYMIIPVDTIGKVDVTVHVNDQGESSKALAIRLALSRALSCFLPSEEVTRMRLAGL